MSIILALLILTAVICFIVYTLERSENMIPVIAIVLTAAFFFLLGLWKGNGTI